jgi:hypothetical protein
MLILKCLLCFEFDYSCVDGVPPYLTMFVLHFVPVHGLLSGVLTA